MTPDGFVHVFYRLDQDAQEFIEAYMRQILKNRRGQ
jgi:hypothetical protein